MNLVKRRDCCQTKQISKTQTSLFSSRFNHKNPLKSNKPLNKLPNKLVNESFAKTLETHINDLICYTKTTYNKLFKQFSRLKH